MYVAESLEDSDQKYVYQGDFGETVEFATRPIVVYYDVVKNHFKTIPHIPEIVSVGQVSSFQLRFKMSRFNTYLYFIN